MMKRFIRISSAVAPIVGLAVGIGLSVFVGSAMKGISEPGPVCGTWGIASPPRGMSASPEEALLIFSVEAAETALNSDGVERERWLTHASAAKVATVDAIAEGSTSLIVKDGGTIVARYTAVQIDGKWGVEEFWHTMPDAFCAKE